MKINVIFGNVEKDPDVIPEEWLLERFRNWRKTELNNSDWTQLPDAPCDSVVWGVYRQSLRDLPALPNFSELELPICPN